MENTTILVVDDEPKLLDVLSSFLTSRGYTVLTAASGTQALTLFSENNIALILLDLMLPDLSGEEVCTAIRKTSRVPIIMLTAKTAESSHLHGLSIGADDYITKPFSLKLVAAHMEALLRRTTDDLLPLTQKSSWRNGDLVIDFEKNRVLKGGKSVHLTASEYKLLSALIKYPGKVFTREELISLVFGDDFDSFDRAVDTHIKNLRQKIEDDTKNPVYVRTLRGIGYQFGGE
ncbi:DNA-binding response regulator [Clostridia bacterium]|nr:DNA-binding response regulator [Clostridia bacterium]